MKWQENAVPVTEQSVAAAISWLEKLTFEQAPNQASRLDALQEAGKDRTVSVCPGQATGHKGGFKFMSHTQYPTAVQPIRVPSQGHLTGAASSALKSPLSLNLILL